MRRIRVHTRTIVSWSDSSPGSRPRPEARPRERKLALEVPPELDPDRYGEFDFGEYFGPEADGVDDPMDAPSPPMLLESNRGNDPRT